jgi:hypothetical protein
MRKDGFNLSNVRAGWGLEGIVSKRLGSLRERPMPEVAQGQKPGVRATLTRLTGRSSRQK